MANTCGICLENGVPIVCSCGLAACKLCIRRYVSDSINEACCMGCKAAYTYEFMVNTLGKTWYHTTYKTTRKNVLFDRELTKTPMAIELMEQLRDRDRAYERMVELRKAHEFHQARYRESFDEYYRLCDIAAGIRRAAAPAAATTTTTVLYGDCPKEDCSGVLDAQRVCVRCKTATCKACLEPVGDTDTESHVCDEDTLKTIEMLRKDTKPCPSCSTPIHKISGCYQMWCTKCHTTFHYRTMEILHEVTHNPHYTEWLANNIHAARPADGARCEGRVTPFRVIDAFRRVLDKNKMETCLEVARFASHVRMIVLPAIRRKIERHTENPQTVRVRLSQYLRGDVTKEYVQKHLFHDYKQIRRWTSLLELWTMCANTVDILVDNALIDKDVATMVASVKKLAGYVNQHSLYIHKAFGNVSPFTFKIKEENSRVLFTTTS